MSSIPLVIFSTWMILVLISI